MWSKNVLAVSYAALLTVGIDAIQNNDGILVNVPIAVSANHIRIDQVLFRRLLVPEAVRGPTLSRRGPPFRNETRSLETVQTRTTISTVTFSTAEESQSTFVSERSTALSELTTPASSSSYHATKTSSTSQSVTGTSLLESNHGSPISTTNDGSGVSTHSMTLESRSSEVTLITLTTSAYDATSEQRTSEQRTSTVSSSALSDSGYGSSTVEKTVSEVQTVVSVSSSTPLAHSTPTPTSTHVSTAGSSSFWSSESSSHSNPQDSEVLWTSTLPPSTYNTLSTTSAGSQLFEPSTTVSPATSNSDQMLPTSSIQTQPTTLATEPHDVTTISSHNEVTVSQSNTASLSVQTLAPTLFSSNLVPDHSSAGATTSSQAYSPSASDISFSNSIPVSESQITDATPPNSTLVVIASTTLTGVSFPVVSGTGSGPSELVSPSTVLSSTQSSTGIYSSLQSESGLSTVTLSVVATSSLVPSETVATPTASFTPSPTSGAAYNQTDAQTATTSATSLSTASSLDINGNTSNTSTVLPSISPTFVSTLPAPSQSLPESTKSFSGWTNTSLSTTGSGVPHSVLPSPTGTGSDYNRTRIEGIQTTLITNLRTSVSWNITLTETTLAPTVSVNKSIITATLSSSAAGNSSSTLLFNGAGYGSTKTLSVTPTSSATTSATVVPPAPPPLTTSQTAGVAVGSTAGVLLAIVAAIFLARRYHARGAARRRSVGSIYPKVAYIYDPVNKGDDDGNSASLMSGGADGFLTSEKPPQYSPKYVQRHSTGFMDRFSDPGNPFRDPEDPLRDSHESARDLDSTPIDAASALAAAIAGYAMASQASSASSTYSAPQTLYDHIIPSPTLSPFLGQNGFRHSRTRSLGQSGFDGSSINGSINTNLAGSTAGMEDVPLSPYGMQASHTLAPIEELTTTGPDADTFEHDLFMPVDTRTETPDSVIVYVPPPTPRMSVSPNLSTILPTARTSAKSLLNVAPAHSARTSQVRLSTKASSSSSLSLSSDSTISRPQRSSLGYDGRHSATHIKPASNGLAHKQSSSTMLSESPPPTPVHRGWDEIKRYSNGFNKPLPLIPTPLPMSSPPLPVLSPRPAKKRSSLQLRRKELVLAGTGQLIKPGTGHALRRKPVFEHKKSPGFEVQRMSLLAKLNNMGEEQSADVPSPGSIAVSESVYSSDSIMHKVIVE